MLFAEYLHHRIRQPVRHPCAVVAVAGFQLLSARTLFNTQSFSRRLCRDKRRHTAHMANAPRLRQF